MTVNNLNELTNHSDLAIRKIEDVYYLLIGEDVYESNEIGAIIVNATGRDLSIDELCTRISKKFSFENTVQIRSDVDEYIEYLLAEGLLSRE